MNPAPASATPDEELRRLRRLAQSLLDPEQLGFACTAEVRDRAREALGLQAVEV